MSRTTNHGRTCCGCGADRPSSGSIRERCGDIGSERSRADEVRFEHCSGDLRGQFSGRRAPRSTYCLLASKTQSFSHKSSVQLARTRRSATVRRGLIRSLGSPEVRRRRTCYSTSKDLFHPLCPPATLPIQLGLPTSKSLRRVNQWSVSSHFNTTTTFSTSLARLCRSARPSLTSNRTSSRILQRFSQLNFNSRSSHLVAYHKMAASLNLPPLPELPSHAAPELAALDAFKLATAAFVSKALEIPLEQAYEGVESGKTGKNVTGDFLIAVPRFRLKGKPQELAQKLVDQVSATARIFRRVSGVEQRTMELSARA